MEVSEDKMLTEDETANEEKELESELESMKLLGEIEQDPFMDNEVELTLEKQHSMPQEFTAYSEDKLEEYQSKESMPNEHFALSTGPNELYAQRIDRSKLGGGFDFPVLQLQRQGGFNREVKREFESFEVDGVEVIRMFDPGIKLKEWNVRVSFEKVTLLIDDGGFSYSSSKVENLILEKGWGQHLEDVDLVGLGALRSLLLLVSGGGDSLRGLLSSLQLLLSRSFLSCGLLIHGFLLCLWCHRFGRKYELGLEIKEICQHRRNWFEKVGGENGNDGLRGNSTQTQRVDGQIVTNSNFDDAIDSPYVNQGFSDLFHYSTASDEANGRLVRENDANDIGHLLYSFKSNGVFHTSYISRENLFGFFRLTLKIEWVSLIFIETLGVCEVRLICSYVRKNGLRDMPFDSDAFCKISSPYQSRKFCTSNTKCFHTVVYCSFVLMESAIIRVIGMGGGGNIVNHMIGSGPHRVDFYAIKMEAQALLQSSAENSIQVEEVLIRGLGIGGNPLSGEQATEESNETIVNSLKGSAMVFRIAGIGGGIDSGVALVVAKLAKEAGYQIVVVVMYPFSFEGRKRCAQALEAIDKLQKNVDIVVERMQNLRDKYLDEFKNELCTFLEGLCGSQQRKEFVFLKKPVQSRSDLMEQILIMAYGDQLEIVGAIKTKIQDVLKHFEWLEHKAGAMRDCIWTLLFEETR